jgi:FkbM family methyltransferase
MRALNLFKDVANCISAVENPYPYLKHRYIDLPRGRQQKPYDLRLRNGIKIHISDVGHDWYTAEEVFINRLYTSNGQKICAGDTVVDIGANVGCFSLLASKLVGSEGRVIAVEPDPQTFSKLQANIKLNQAKNIVVLCGAVGETDGQTTLFRHTNPLFSSLHEEVDGRTTANQPVPTDLLTLESFFKEYNIDKCQYLKLDCEGSEYGIVRSMSPELAARISQITMEMHSVPGESEAQLDSSLKQYGFKLDDTGILSFYHR